MPSKQAQKSRSKAIAAIREKMAERPDTKLLWDTIYALEHKEANDRALALVLGAIIEQGLETAILSHCIKLNETEQRNLFQGGDDAALAFGPKIRLGYALGIYGDGARTDLDCVRHIRNLFAHTKSDIRFTSTEVRDITQHFRWVTGPWGAALEDALGHPVEDSRDIFIETTRYFFAYFITEEQKGKPVRSSEYLFPEAFS